MRIDAGECKCICVCVCANEFFCLDRNSENAKARFVRGPIALKVWVDEKVYSPFRSEFFSFERYVRAKIVLRACVDVDEGWIKFSHLETERTLCTVTVWSRYFFCLYITHTHRRTIHHPQHELSSSHTLTQKDVPCRRVTDKLNSFKTSNAFQSYYE